MMISISHRLQSLSCKPVLLVTTNQENKDQMSVALSGSHFIFPKSEVGQLIDILLDVAGEKQ